MINLLVFTELLTMKGIMSNRSLTRTGAVLLSGLTTAEQALWVSLGWDAASWDGYTGAPASQSKSWSQLTVEEQDAATALGYDQTSWDDS